MKKIVFVCTGNTCRSPMAEGFFKKMLSDMGCTDIEVYSAGIAAAEGQPASDHSIKVMDEFGIDISAHRASPIKQNLLDADLIITMTDAQRKAIEKYSKTVITMPIPIPDPFGGSLEEYRNCRDAIVSALKILIENPEILL